MSLVSAFRGQRDVTTRNIEGRNAHKSTYYFLFGSDNVNKVEICHGILLPRCISYYGNTDSTRELRVGRL